LDITTAAAQPGAKSLVRRIADFPLVAMVTAVLLLIFTAQIANAASRALPALEPELAIAANGVITLVLVFAVYKLAIRRLGEHPRDDLRLANARRDLGLGLGLGFLLFSLVVGTAALLDVYNIVGEGGVAQLVKILVAMAIVPAVVEELLFRGILFRWLEEFGGSWFALAATSALFGLAHIFNPNASALSSFAIALEAGLLLGGAYMLTRSLWMPIGLHAAWNFTQGFIWDVPVSGIDQQGLVEARLSGPELLSGGSFGLEASVIAMVIATAAGVWLVWRSVRQGELMSPWWVRRRLARAEQPAPTADV
jgi:membrane protease YdiL (CAAX protease family)